MAAVLAIGEARKLPRIEPERDCGNACKHGNAEALPEPLAKAE